MHELKQLHYIDFKVYQGVSPSHTLPITHTALWWDNLTKKATKPKT